MAPLAIVAWIAFGTFVVAFAFAFAVHLVMWLFDA